MSKFLIKYEKYLAYLGWAIFAAVGLLQMFRVKGGLITNCGADIIAPAMLYYSIRVNKTILNRIFKKGLNEKQTFILLWILCVGWETSQRSDLSGTILFFAKGTFDYFDIFAYTLTLFVCYNLDGAILKSKKMACDPSLWYFSIWYNHLINKSA